ncbi:hypothetical protein Tco_0741298 [Tanacetum coccineum]
MHILVRLDNPFVLTELSVVVVSEEIGIHDFSSTVKRMNLNLEALGADGDVLEAFQGILKYLDEVRMEPGHETFPFSAMMNANSPPGSPDSFLKSMVLRLHSWMEVSRLENMSPPRAVLQEEQGDGVSTVFQVYKVSDDFGEGEEDSIGSDKNEVESEEELGVNNFDRVHVIVGNFTYRTEFLVIEDIGSVIDYSLSNILLGKPFVDESHMSHDRSLGIVRFTDGVDVVTYRMPHMMEQFRGLLSFEKDQVNPVYLRNEEDKRRGVITTQNFHQMHNQSILL